jgi:hypothetical protein
MYIFYNHFSVCLFDKKPLSMKMETTAKLYEVKFVLDVTQLGADDPLWQNVCI